MVQDWHRIFFMLLNSRSEKICSVSPKLKGNAHKDDSLFSILTVTMIIIIYLGNKSDSEKNSIWRLWVLFHLYCVERYEKPSLS